MRTSVTRLCLVRHGETTWNAERRIQGQIDVPLNAAGLAQAGALARGLAPLPITAIYSSDLTRARQTALPVARTLDLPVRYEVELRERHFGLFQSLTREQAARCHPEAYARFDRRDAACNLVSGESLLDLAARVRRVLTRIAAAHRGETVLVVTHGGALDICYRPATGSTLETARDFALPNAALNWVEHEHEHGRWQIVRWGDNAHLLESLDELPG